MTEDDNRILRAGAKPLLTTVLYGVLLVTVGLLIPGVPKPTAFILAAVFLALMGWTGDAFFRAASSRERCTGLNETPYILVIWGNRLAFGTLAVSILLRGLGLSRLYVLAGLGTAMFGAAVLVAGGAWAMPGEMRIWRESRLGRTGEE